MFLSNIHVDSVPQSRKLISRKQVQKPKNMSKTKFFNLIILRILVLVIPKTKFTMIVPEVERLLSSLCDGVLESVCLFGIEVDLD